MRIVIDMQGAQRGSRQHGIGRHALSLARAIVRNRGAHEIFLALNGLLPDTVETIRVAFDDLLPQENIRVWQAPGPVRSSSNENDWRRRTAELIRESFLASLKPDMVLVTSLFEGLSEDTVTSIGTLSSAVPTAVILYDLVAHIHRRSPQDNLAAKAWYENKLQHLRRTDLLFAVSESSRQKAVRYLGFPDEACVNIATALTGNTLRSDSETQRYQPQRNQQFLWDAGAQRVIAAIEAWHVKQGDRSLTDALPACRPRLAYVSPLPPERSGISDYSAELLPALANHYDIDVIVAQDSVSDSWIQANCSLRSAAWLREHADRYDRVLYHFGNSHFHQHMFDLLAEVPGVVVLHDFFLSGVVEQMKAGSHQPGAWVETLYRNHGYTAVQQWFQACTGADMAQVIWRYPCNLEVLQNALGMIVHAESSRQLARLWYGNGAADDWAVVPLPRAPAIEIDRAEARHVLNLGNDDFVVCSFGMLGPAKLNHRLLDAWLASDLARDAHCVLVFVGENHHGDYGAEFVATMRLSGLGERIRITGWADAATYRQYLAAADIGVQLRGHSRGETSAAVLDCMNYGLPAIVNANGSMGELPDETVWKLPDKFSDAALTDALEVLWRDPQQRQRLGANARETLLVQHAPLHCAARYTQAIEKLYRTAEASQPALIQALASIEPQPADERAWVALAEAVALTVAPRPAQRQILVDISALAQNDLKTGIQRVVRSILRQLLADPPVGCRVEPVYAAPGQPYRYARHFTLTFLGCPEAVMPDDRIEFGAGDLFLGLDLNHTVVTQQQGFYRHMRGHGVQIWFVVYDLLPLTMPHTFFEATTQHHGAWLKVVAENDGALCISRAVAGELAGWLKAHGTARQRPFKIEWFHLGADIGASAPTRGLPKNATAILAALAARPCFLMVGTVEPRKGHGQALAAFEKLWEQGVDAGLVIVGKQGWMVEGLIKRLRCHPERDKRLFWLEGISDEFLEKIYAVSLALIAASEDEGFGLPLIEAAQHKLPVIARDIPVFREVAQQHAYYFSGLEPQSLADAIQQWLVLHDAGDAPQSEGMPWLTWEQSTRNLLHALMPRAAP